MVSLNHHQLANVFGILGNIISFMVFLAPLPTFFRIYKNKCTEGFEPLPYMVALFSCMLWLFFGIIQTSFFYIMTINLIGCVIEVIYCIIYTVYAPRDKRKSTIKTFVGINVVLFTLILLIIQFAIPKDYKVIGLEWICLTVSVCVFAAPLSIVVRVIKTRSVQFMPFNLSLFLTLSAIVWLGYGLCKQDVYVFLPNVLGILFGIIQMVLYAYYKKYGGENDDEQDKEPSMTGFAVVNPLALLESGDVVPFPLDENNDIIEDVINQQH